MFNPDPAQAPIHHAFISSGEQLQEHPHWVSLRQNRDTHPPGAGTQQKDVLPVATFGKKCAALGAPRLKKSVQWAAPGKRIGRKPLCVCVCVCVCLYVHARVGLCVYVD